MATRSIEKLRKTSDEELIVEHDQIARTTQPGTAYYTEELARRGQSRQNDIVLKYTKQMAWMTAVVTVATIVNLVIAVILLARS